jgi:hypothetical protein
MRSTLGERSYVHCHIFPIVTAVARSMVRVATDIRWSPTAFSGSAITKSEKKFSAFRGDGPVPFGRKRIGLAALRQCNSDSSIAIQHCARACAGRANFSLHEQTIGQSICNCAIKQREK